MDNAASGNSILANLFRLNQWANVELIDACARMGDEVLDVSDDALWGHERVRSRKPVLGERPDPSF